MGNPFIARLGHVPVGAKRLGIVNIFGTLVDDGAGFTVIGPLTLVICDKILPNFWPKKF